MAFKARRAGRGVFTPAMRFKACAARGKRFRFAKIFCAVFLGIGFGGKGFAPRRRGSIALGIGLGGIGFRAVVAFGIGFCPIFALGIRFCAKGLIPAFRAIGLCPVFALGIGLGRIGFSALFAFGIGLALGFRRRGFGGGAV